MTYFDITVGPCKSLVVSDALVMTSFSRVFRSQQCPVLAIWLIIITKTWKKQEKLDALSGFSNDLTANSVPPVSLILNRQSRKFFSFAGSYTLPNLTTLAFAFPFPFLTLFLMNVRRHFIYCHIVLTHQYKI